MVGIFSYKDNLQKEFEIEISAGDITLDNFDTINAIKNFIAQKRDSDQDA